MGYIKEPKNVDLVVGPSILTSATRKTILQAIAQYKKTGQKPLSVKVDKGPVEESVHIGPRKKTK
ncbi:hypothetical protein [Desertivirga xinjiangensis]|uniref:hypothetical protein n=1 Tax=Desertivirga xinjiangensis TaxID=539206 RepID=UPI00210A20A0|nr:hypothetical protein [Pedobacter xinjiangensis]